VNYYERHIGDYLKDTAHLSLLEHGVYGRLLDVYYTREAPLSDIAQVARLIGARSTAEKSALRSVLGEFFAEGPEGWKHSRCDREIARFQDKQRKAKASADARWAHSERNANASPDAMRTHSEGNAPTRTGARPSPDPDTRHQTQSLQAELAGVGGSAPSADPPPPPPAFDGKNAETLNGKAIVAIAVGWELPDQWGLDAEALGFKPPEVLREAEKFRQFWTAGKGKGTRRSVKGWRQTWSNWLGKAAENRR
jgi:uncharacterized protein YdaU (DUF1376 family)